uniref:WD repeat-containing protein 79 n=1 Tax=Lynceus sp. MCZ IZ 141354 TaxID=1930659 RepID=A0A9N6ZFV2_9CRUS|nr:EOG090X06W9 [Lynceus sp. MCZ IZ 141354]
MSSWDPATCLLASTCRDNPVHLWDAYNGKLVATYRYYNNVDEVEAAHSVCFDTSGERLFCGFDSKIAIFNVAVPGRDFEVRKLKEKGRVSQQGIISCISFNEAMPSLYALGSFSKTIGIYMESDANPLCLLQGQVGGVTHLKFSPDGTKLYSGGRKDPEILCWDLRSPGKILYNFQREVATNQRIYFDLDPSGSFLVSGSTSGNVRIWDSLNGDEISEPEECVQVQGASWNLHSDCVNGISLHSWLPILASTSGQRHFAEPVHDSDPDSEDPDAPLLTKKYMKRSQENAVKLWWLGDPLSLNV